MKNFILLSIFNLFLLEASAQQQFNCSSHFLYEEQLKNDPVFRKNQEKLEQETGEYIKNKAANKSASAATYIIPIVFHIIHTGGTGNISDAQVRDQVAILNKEFPRQQADTALTPFPFKSIAAPFSVEFRLATLDPLGNCTNGINRIYSSLATCSLGWDDVKGLTDWPSSQYLNIWLIETMHYPGDPSCTGGGYSTFPGGPANKDGIVMRGDLISNIGTSATNPSWGNFKGRYLIHELGHWFNLRHIWGDANCGNDQVADTPPAVIDNSGCPSFPHNPNNTCGSNSNGEMFTDYMDYTNGSCLNMFTAGQVARMTTAINSLSSGRNNLWNNSNLNATGTNNPYVYPIACAAVPDILPYGPITVCAGDSVKFTDYSYGGVSTSRLWDFSGQGATSLTDSIVKVRYTTPGIYSLSLTKNYLSTSKTTTFTNKVYVLSGTPNLNYSFPFKDSLEDPFKFDSDWMIVNKANDATTWEFAYSSSYSGFSCAAINNFGNVAPSTDELISPAYDLSAVQNPTLSFRLHYARVLNTNSDKLQVFVSNSCGNTWTSIYSKDAAVLKTVVAGIAGSYTPAVASSEWREEKVNMFPFLATGTVRFKFVFTSGGGNNIFIDDINIDGITTVGLKDYFLNGAIDLFPNPTSGDLNLKYNLKNKSAVQLEVTDVLGKVCLTKNLDQALAGENQTSLNTNALVNGVYFIRLKQNNTVIYNTKFVKQSSY